jgi:hypothetical protein
MLIRSVGTLVFALLATAVAYAQQPVPAAGAKPQTKPTPAPADASNTVRPAEPAGQAVNVKLDLTITDQMGPQEPAKKTITLIVADRAAGSIRSMGNNVRATLNVDATPQILSNGTIKVLLGLEYNPRQVQGKMQTAKLPSGETVELPNEGGSSLNQRVSIVLVPGKPFMLSQAADPISDRKITVEIRAEILK